MLYRTLQEHLESILERSHLDGRGLPGFVLRELRAFLRCGVWAFGFLRVRCPACRQEFPLPFSCKKRGFCPSCCGRFMAETALNLVDRILPDVAYRQWVLTLPFALRPRAAYDPRVHNTVLHRFITTLRRWHEDRARAAGVKNPHWGAVSVLQRVDSGLRLAPHSHTLSVDGAFAVDSRGLYARFHPLQPPTDDEVAELVARVADRVIRALVRRGLIESPHEANEMADPLLLAEPSQAACYAASAQGRIAFGPDSGRLVDRQRDPFAAQRPYGPKPLCAQARGFNLHAAVTVGRGDRGGLLRMCRYLTRPPLATDRLELRDDGRIAYHLRKPFSDGTTAVLFTSDSLIQHLAAMVPRPRSHRVRYHGVLASAARHRALVVPQPVNAAAPEPDPRSAEQNPPNPAEPPIPQSPAASSRTRLKKLVWAELMKRSMGIDPLICAQCGSRMRIIAAILRAEVVRAILASLGLPAEEPRMSPARAPPDDEFHEVTDLIEIPLT